METVYLNDIACHTAGRLPAVGSTAPDFRLVTKDLKEISLSDYKGKNVVLNIFPSIDTGVCAMSVRKFNQHAASLTDTAVICVSMDLPFAAARFCAAEGIDNVTVASAFREPQFARDYGVRLADGPLAGLRCRAVIIIDRQGKIAYCQLVDQITNEPDYTAALSALKNIAR